MANQYSFRVWYVVGASSVYWNGSAWNTGTPDAAVQLPIQVVGSTGTVAWYYPGTVPGQNVPMTISHLDGTTYGVAIQALDNAGNLETPTTVQFVLDRVGPNISLTTPTAVSSFLYYGSPSNALPTISGTANDSPAGVSQVFLEINDLTDNTRWNGSSWAATASTGYLVAVGTNPWTLPGPAWIGNRQYQIFAYGVDNAGNISPNASTSTFIYDVNKPSTTIMVPNVAAYPFGQPAALTGTAVDWNSAGDATPRGCRRSRSPSATRRPRTTGPEPSSAASLPA